MKVLLIILLAFFIARWLMLRFAPILLASFFKNMRQQQGYSDPHHTKARKEGEIKIKQVEKQDKKIDKDVGDYVAYTEVNEKTK